ncbi:MAG: sulfatase-like hydrolase/transferase [Bacteroidales bacterium]|nr:sulfatase-like hydrolase/transferase [Bacteroidales bacterium]
MKYTFKHVLLFAPLFLFSCTIVDHDSTKALKPNVIIILAEDLGYSDIAYLGSEINTPNLDLMAEKGLVLTHFYDNAGSFQTTASILTGLYPPQCMNEGDLSLNNQCLSIAELMNAAGYSTLLAGTWMSGDSVPNTSLYRGFSNFVYPGYNSQGRLGEPSLSTDISHFLSSGVIDFIDSCDKTHNPFFIYLSYPVPAWSDPMIRDDSLKYLARYSEGWVKTREARYLKLINNGILGINENISADDPELPDWDQADSSLKEDWAWKMETYANSVEHMDQEIGRILEELQKKGKADNTLIIFFSDNGSRIVREQLYENNSLEQDSAINSGLYAKTLDPEPRITNTPFKYYSQYVREGGISSPFIAYWPGGIDEAGISSMPTHVIDILPTMLELSGAIYPDTLNGNAILPFEGISLLPFFTGEEPEEHEYLIWEFEGRKALRMEDYKIVFDENDEDWQIYDIESDRCELENLAEDAPQEIRGMKKIFKQEANRIGLKD